MNTDFNIEEFLSLEGYATDERQARRKGSGGSQEFFSPPKLVRRMCDKISPEMWSDPEKDFLEPCMGHGNFICYIIYNKIIHGSTWEQALSHTWGVELIESNVQETHERIIDMLTQMGVEFDKGKAMEIIRHNLVCSDFFKWDFENWCPIKEEKALPLF